MDSQNLYTLVSLGVTGVALIISEYLGVNQNTAYNGILHWLRTITKVDIPDIEMPQLQRNYNDIVISQSVQSTSTQTNI
jgi:hypothetical protein